MAKGENIFRRKDGRWEARYIKGYQPSGKIRYGFCYGRTYKEAKEKVMKLRTYSDMIRVADQERRFAFYCDEWLSAVKKRVKAATYVKYESLLSNHIKPALGGHCHESIGSRLIERFTDILLREKCLSPKTVRDILTCLRSVIWYTSKKYPGTIPPIEIVYPKEETKEMRVLSPDEQERSVRYLMTDMDECKAGVLLALLNGLRIGEICALKWGDIDLIGKTMYIHATMQRLKDVSDEGDGRTKIMIGSPKSDKSVRTIPMTEQAVMICAGMRTDKEDYVLTGSRGYMEPRTLQYRLKKYTAACGLDGVHFHTLRHTFATRAVEVGFEIKTLSEILGHSTTTVTLDRYVHSSMELKRANMNKLGAIGM